MWQPRKCEQRLDNWSSLQFYIFWNVSSVVFIGDVSIQQRTQDSHEATGERHSKRFMLVGDKFGGLMHRGTREIKSFCCWSCSIHCGDTYRLMWPLRKSFQIWARGSFRTTTPSRFHCRVSAVIRIFRFWHRDRMVIQAVEVSISLAIHPVTWMLSCLRLSTEAAVPIRSCRE